MFDKLRVWGLPSARLPYGQAAWWDQAYEKLDGGFAEWGGLGYADLETHSYCPVTESYAQSFATGKLVSARLADEALAGRARKPGGDLLVLGGGASQLSREMHTRGGWPSILDIDFSANVVQYNKNLELKSGSGAGNLSFAVVDARSMRADTLAGLDQSAKTARTFDVCIDKGLIDALWCGGIESTLDIRLVVSSVAAVLKPGGRFITFSYSQADIILNQFHSAPGIWSAIEVRKLRSMTLYVLERSQTKFRKKGEGHMQREGSINSSAGYAKAVKR